MKLTDEQYKTLKWAVLIALPAITTFIGAVGGTIHFPHLDATLTILVAFTTLLGTLVGVSSHQYNLAHSEDGEDGEDVVSSKTETTTNDNNTETSNIDPL